MPFVGKRAHYWIEDTKTMPPTIGEAGRVRYYQALCGATAVTNLRVPALAQGSWQKCENCLKQTRLCADAESRSPTANRNRG